jgi:hypothetical protein
MEIKPEIPISANIEIVHAGILYFLPIRLVDKIEMFIV